jgi:adenosine deaminase
VTQRKARGSGKRTTRAPARKGAPAEGPGLPLKMIERIPKTDLHVHVDGSMRIATIWDLAKAQGVDLGARSHADLEKKLCVGDDCQSLVDYLRIFDITLKVLQEPEALERAAYELGIDSAAENVWYMEVRYSPVLHLERRMSTADSVEAVLRGLKRAEHETGIRTGVIICGIRQISPDVSLELAELAIAYKNTGVVAFDLAGQEKDYPAKKHREAFYIILNNNVNTTVHAGEAFGPKSIHQALHYCGAHRIGHGTLLHEDRDLMQYVCDHRIPLEICLSSNVHTRVVPNLEAHPFRIYHEAGLRVTLNTDNRLISDTTMTKELHLATRAFDLDPYELRHIVINGYRSAFIRYRDKQALLKSAITEMDKVIAEYYDLDDEVYLEEKATFQ